MDGIEGLRSLPKHSVDMLLTDPPYGTTRNYWDVPLPLPELWEAVKWAVKPNGAVLFFAQCPFDKVLGASNLAMLRYEWVWYKERGTGFFSIVLCEQASPSYQKSWQLARRNLLFTSPETEDFMIIGHQEDLTSSLDPNLSIQLSRALIDRDQTVARKIADSFFSRYLETANTQEARKLTTILLCEVYVALLDFGDDIPDTQLSPYLKKLENAADPSECSRIFFSCIQGLLNAKTKTSMEAHTYICQAISYIQQHYREELSVPQIADVVSLNPVYLSRLFKLDTGKTLSEYLNCYRTECSLALLTDTADTIQSISQKVGYSDVRSYIRFFKKYYDVTPSEYRRGAVGK